MTAKVISLNIKPGIQRDGTQFDAPVYVDGKWVRFQRGRPRKMGGYRGIFQNASGISRGMVSKIENGISSTSLDTLHKIATALGETLSHLFLNFDKPSGGGQLIKKGKGMEVVRRGTKRGHLYELLAYGRGPRKLFDPFLVTLTDASEVFPTFQHPGTELIYMLEGKMVYRHGQHTYTLSVGDTLTFDAPVPHGPEKFIKLPIKMLVLIVYDDTAAEVR